MKRPCAVGTGAIAATALLVCGSSRDAGASPLFPPEQPDGEAARTHLLHVVRRDPHQFGLACSRWTLQHLREQVATWHVQSDGGMHQLVDRLNIHYKRARSYIHSPDPFYTQKLARQSLIQTRVQEQAPAEVCLFQDECSIRRQPSVGYNYEASGSDAPHAQWQPCYDTLTRIMATLDAFSGQVVYTLIGKVTTSALVRFYRKITAAYPQARRIWIVQVPTYASWCNPIEKLWRWLKQDLIHLHRCAHDLDQLRTHIRTFLDAFATGSQELVQYVGLSSN
jgi:hypothetical protein